jgi:hypothetical protein
MATPSGYRTFTSGEVLTAENVMNYLMDQSVLVFAGTAAAGSALPSPAEGQLRFLKDTDSLEFYSGTSWTAVGGGDVGFEQTFLLMGA